MEVPVIARDKTAMLGKHRPCTCFLKDDSGMSSLTQPPHWFGTDGEVARFINNLGKDVAFDIELCYLSGLFNRVHEYYSNSWHVQWASFKYTYFDTPWSFISALAAFVLLVLTVAQTLFTVLGYLRPPN